MKIELTEVSADLGLRGKAELWVRVLTSDPLGPQAWDSVKTKIAPAALAGYSRTISGFFVDQWDEDDPERLDCGFEQWFIFEKGF